MFAKLLKHELRAGSGLPLILNFASLGVAVLGGFSLRIIATYGEDMNTVAMLTILSSLLFFLLAMVGCYVATEILLLVRFYRNKFTDQGYLTFTLPVNSHQIFLTSFISILLWVIASTTVLIGGLCLFGWIGLSGSGEDLGELLDTVAWIFSEYDVPTDYTVITYLETAVDAVYSIVLAMSCITVGSIIAKKLKVLVAFGLYYGVSFVSGIITSVITYTVSFDYWFSASMDDYYQNEIRGMVLVMIWNVILIIGGYILSTQLMKKKLNLP